MRDAAPLATIVVKVLLVGSRLVAEPQHLRVGERRASLLVKRRCSLDILDPAASKSEPMKVVLVLVVGRPKVRIEPSDRVDATLVDGKAAHAMIRKSKVYATLKPALKGGHRTSTKLGVVVHDDRPLVTSLEGELEPPVPRACHPKVFGMTEDRESLIALLALELPTNGIHALVGPVVDDEDVSLTRVLLDGP
jgi:hypothetical protein